ncbi:MAG: hypothetical protein WA700_10800 [Acidobacteriaceae bacterium]
MIKRLTDKPYPHAILLGSKKRLEKSSGGLWGKADSGVLNPEADIAAICLCCYYHLRRGQLTYDFLILATGIRYSYFGHDEWRSFAPGLESLDDADVIRSKILLAFERAEEIASTSEAPTETQAEEIRRLLTFVLVGGGAYLLPHWICQSALRLAAMGAWLPDKASSSTGLVGGTGSGAEPDRSRSKSFLKAGGTSSLHGLPD